MRASWWARRSLRSRLTAATTAVILVGLSAAGALLVWQVHSSLIGGLDAAVSQRVQVVADQASRGELPVRLTAAPIAAPAVQVIDAAGAVVSRSRGVDDRHRMFTLAARDKVRVATALARLTDDSDGDADAGRDDGDDDDLKSFRVAAIAVTSPIQGRLTVYAAEPTDPVSDSTGQLTGALAVGVPVMTVVLGVVAWLLVGLALRPVEVLRRQAAAIPGTDLARRLPPAASRDELARLTDTLNELLSRIESAAVKQRQFIADAAHELRSPVASLTAQLEVAALHPERVAPDGNAGLLADTQRLGRLVGDLLALARIDAAPRPTQLRPVDLDDLVLDEVRRMRGRGPRIDAAGVSAARVEGDPAALARVVRNLLDNAVRHAASLVSVSLAVRGSAAQLAVTDDGPGIPAADRRRVFERFVRLDEARARDDGGSGLGLAIVAEVVRTHGGTVIVGDNHPGARFVVTLPAAT